MRKITYTTLDGQLRVVTPVINTIVLGPNGKFIHQLEPITEEQAENRALGALPPDAVAPQFIAADQVPSDRTFRNAWTAAPGRIVHDMAKCREIKKEELRRRRKPLLEALDAEVNRARREKNEVKLAELEAKYQPLLDVTEHPAIAAAQTPEELKALVFAALE